MPSDPHFSRRLHPATLLFTIGGSVKTLLLPGLAVLWFARGHGGELWFMALFVPSVLLQLIRYFSLSYRFGPQEMVIREGVISRNERHIPYDRIQNIDLVQGPLHRVLGVAEVRLQTASGADAEATLKVLSLAAVEELRHHLFAQRLEPQRPDVQTDDALVTLSLLDLVKFGLITMRGLAMVFIALGAAVQFDVLERLDFDWLLGLGKSLQKAAPVGLTVAVLAAAALFFLIVLSIAWTVLRFYGYRLERHGEDLRVTCGLFTRVAATIPRRRIQFISVQESLGHRLFGCVSIHIETAGGKEEDIDVSSRWFVPMLPCSDVPRVLAELRPGLDLQIADWQPLAPRAFRRLLTGRVLLAVVPAAASYLLLGWWSLLMLAVLIAIAVWHAARTARTTRYAVLPQGIAYRSGVFTRRTSATFFDKMQVITVRESPFDRRHGMATLGVDTAGAGPADDQIRIAYLPADTARALLAMMLPKTEAAQFRW